jgi:hypothetical protein
MSRIYTNKDCARFVQDMEKAGLEVEHYQGRNFWKGPAVRVDVIQDAFSHTKVRCQQDSMGMGAIVYPIASDEGIECVCPFLVDREHLPECPARGVVQPEPADDDEDESGEDTDAELIEQYQEFMSMYADLKGELRRRNPNAYRQWQAGGFLIDSDIVSMYPTLGVALEIEEE